MKPEEINIEIAKACGWKYEINKCSSYFAWRDPKTGIYQNPNPPNYYGDLNACHEMEKVLSDKWVKYINNLLDGTKSPEENHWILLHATAPQRCEAFLKTIKEDGV